MESPYPEKALMSILYMVTKQTYRSDVYNKRRRQSATIYVEQHVERAPGGHSILVW